MSNEDIIPGFQIIIENTFDELDIHDKIKLALKEMNMVKMTPIQAKCIPHLLEGKDVMGAAKTGSGKTLAFLIPLINKIMDSDFEPKHGTAAIIISPTRELSLQIFEVLSKLVNYTNLKTGLLVGGNNRDIEAKYLKEGVTIIVATPGRLLDHLNNNKFFLFHRLQTLVIDEADRLMEQGFIDEMRAIVRKLPTKRQTVLFSATLKTNSAKLKNKMKKQVEPTKKKTSLDEKVLTLACLSMKENCMCFDLSKVDLVDSMNISKNAENATNSQLNQVYVICKDSDRFRLLYSFIKKHSNKKVMVFMSTCMEVKFYYELLNLITVPVLALHGKQSQTKRLKNFDKFKEKQSATILCTDVAARGLDIPHVDWVIQYDPPEDPKEYIHRVGRTARAGAAGQALIFLRSSETGFLTQLAKQRVPLIELEFDESKILPIQDSFEKIVQSNQELQNSARTAFSSVVTAYRTFSPACIDAKSLDLRALAKTFGLKEPPHLTEKSNKSKTANKRGVGNNSDEDNCYMPSKKSKR